jgi:hypothetical protein
VSASADGGGVTVRGQLVDDAGSPIAGASIAVSAFGDEKLGTPTALRSLEPCGGGARLVRPPRGPRASDGLVTDDRGGFCAIAKGVEAKALRLRYAGSKVHDPVERDVKVEVEPEKIPHAVLRFESSPEMIELDRESVTITISLRVEQADAPAVPAGRREGLELKLEDERGAHLADAVTGGDGKARFEVKTALLAGPGAGELVARFAGNAALAKASVTQPIVRRAEVRLALARPIEGGDAEEGVPIEVEVTTARGPAEGGVVEVRRTPAAPPPSAAGPPESVGAGAVVEGKARPVASFASGGATLVPLGLRYVPAAPWYRAGPELRVEARLAGPGVVRQLLLAAAVLLAAAWVVGGWRRAPKPRLAPGVEGRTAPPSGRAGVQVLGPAEGTTGWRGTVADAHDGAPVAGARLAIVAPTFEGDGVVARAVADERGAFALEASYRSDARLVVESDHHSAHEQALPPPSVLAVALITRRRALLERLVRWARRQGAPFDGAPEPTPGHVRRAAGRSNAQAVEAWAGRIEQAAYGPEPVLEPLERELREAEPRPARPEPGGG